MRTQLLRDNHWQDMLHHGSQIFKFEDSSESAWKMVDSIVDLNRSRGQVLQIQRELVDALKLIPDTEADQKLRNDLDQVSKKNKEQRKAQKKGESKRLELENEIAQAREQMKFMQVPVSQRVLAFLSLAIDKILDAVALSPPAPESSITRLDIDCDRRILYVLLFRLLGMQLIRKQGYLGKIAKLRTWYLRIVLPRALVNSPIATQTSLSPSGRRWERSEYPHKGDTVLVRRNE